MNATARPLVRACLAVLSLALLMFGLDRPAAAAGDRFVLKYACFAPEGSTYLKAMRAWDAELRQRSADRLSFRIYPGGIQGDERDMIRKVRIGQLHMVGMTGIGLGEVLPAIRILEMPAYYRDYAEVDAATRAVEPLLEQMIREKSYELLGWGEAGTVHIFSKEPLDSLADLAASRMWAYEGDTLSAELFRVFNIKPVPLSLADVLTSLESGAINGVYSSPLGMVALQWASKVKYMTEQSLGRAMGGTVISASAFGGLPPDLQALLKETGRKYHAQIVEGARQENTRAIDTLKQQGIKTITIPPAEWASLQQGAATVRTNLTGSQWPASLLQAVDKAVEAHRAAGGPAPVSKPKAGAASGVRP